MPTEDLKIMDEGLANRDLQYPNMKLIVLKKGKFKGETEDKVIYYDGIEGFEPEITIRLNELTPGTYFVLFLVDFKDDDCFRRVNLNLYSKFCTKRDEKMDAIIKRTSANNSWTRKYMGPDQHDEKLEVKFERLDRSTFASDFFDRIE